MLFRYMTYVKVCVTVVVQLVYVYVALNETELNAVNQKYHERSVFGTLNQWVDKHYRDFRQGWDP